MTGYTRYHFILRFAIRWWSRNSGCGWSTSLSQSLWASSVSVHSQRWRGRHTQLCLQTDWRRFNGILEGAWSGMSRSPSLCTIDRLYVMWTNISTLTYAFYRWGEVEGLRSVEQDREWHRDRLKSSVRHSWITLTVSWAEGGVCNIILKRFHWSYNFIKTYGVWISWMTVKLTTVWMMAAQHQL